MGDEKYFTVQVKGTAYRFRPIPSDDLAMVLFVTSMGATETKAIKAVTKVLATSAGAEQWDALTDRLIAGEVTIKEVSVSLLEKIVKRQKKDETAATADDAE